MSRPTPDQALEQYCEELKRRGLSNKQLTLARHFLRHLISTLRDLPQDGTGYRKAAELTLRNFPEDVQFVDLIRDFYPHWSGEAPDTSGQATSSPAPRPATSASAGGAATLGGNSGSGLQAALGQMDADPWSHASLAQLERHTHQLKSLVRYAEELRKLGLEDANVHARIKLIKLLLYTIRDMVQNTDNYRTGVDQVLAYITQQERWQVFVTLAREFFYFLANDPEAASRLQKQIPTADLNSVLAS
ncbi:hypothetical protein [Chitinimonas sp. BJYL2]|uniref:hypothetical protein n=1 Tax=Chitinimonas sp. BJYL2 TaxID=2976696 RepID=UPI0022B2B316|nr:hypothetical protein [Chitinimonas sp. BJYL2]